MAIAPGQIPKASIANKIHIPPSMHQRHFPQPAMHLPADLCMAGLSLPAVHPGTSGSAVVAEGGKEDEHKQLYPERLHLALASSDQMKGLDAAAFCAATAAAMGCAAAGTFPYQERPTPAMSAVAANRVLLVTEPPAIGTTPKLAAYFSTNTEVRINQ